MKKLFVFLTMMVLATSTFAYDFSAVCPSGQTLYYTVLSLSEQTVALTYYDYYYAGWEQWETYYYGAPEAPSGDLIIPETVEYHDIQFTVTKIGANAFRLCNITSVVIPNSITTIGDGAFYTVDYEGHGLIGELVLPENLQSIGSEAFSWNTRLTKVTIPNSVKVIGYRCFEICINLSHLTIGSGVEEIGNYAFDDCRSLDTIVVDRATPPTCGPLTFFRVPKDIPVYVPVGSKVLYEQAEAWSAFTNFIEEETLAVNENETNGFAVYPNPTNNVLFVETQNFASLPTETYRITNLMGQTVLLGYIYAEKQRIDIRNLSKGLYFFTVGEQTKKLVIE